MARHRAGDLDGARELYQGLLAARPERPDVLNLLGMVARQSGQIDQAVELFRRAARADPANPINQFQLGEALRAKGPDSALAAIAAYRRAVTIEPRLVDAHTNLGLTCLAQGFLGEAVESLRHAAALEPEDAGNQANLGIALRETFEPEDAVAALARAHRLAPAHPAYGAYLKAMLEEGGFVTAPPSARRELEAAFAREDVDHQALAPAAAALLKLSPSFQGLLALAASEHIEMLPAAVAGASFDEEFESPLWAGLLRHSLIMDPELEGLHTRLRQVVLEEGRSQLPSEDFVAERKAHFVSALAMQAHRADYLWPESGDEGAMAGVVTKGVARRLGELGQGGVAAMPDPSLWHQLIIAACYRPLSEIENADRLLGIDVASQPPYLRRLLVQQLFEPAREATLADTIGRAGDGEVGDTAMSGPVPRWASCSLPEAVPLGLRLAGRFPERAPPEFAFQPMRVLLAGAGSGQGAIELAAGLPESEVVAADARIDNLAYAARKAERYGLENLSFVQAGAADLAALGKRFHLIDSGELLLGRGAGTDAETLALLAGLLEPEGVLLAGVYSGPARAALAAGREAAANIVAEPPLERLRKARHSLLAGEAPSPLAAWPAFYAQAGATELLYGSGGSAFDLAQLAAAAGAAGLQALGPDIDDPHLAATYQERFADDERLDNLANWAALEAEQPELFGPVLRLWCQKRETPTE